ncbi:MAG: S24/S26 family peptidase [Bacteroidales bacterium]|nr:S24/S26 family peptidase [Bacteroidales bacterium]
MEKRVLPNKVLLEEVAALVAQGKDVVFTPKGNSMLPFIRGDRDSVRLSACGEPEEGDIILARHDGRYVLHRVVSVGEKTLLLMGDGNLQGTERVLRSDILGKVTAILRENGRTVIPGKGRLWRVLKPLRRYILGIYRRIAL